jgi:hypothetical protein
VNTLKYSHSQWSSLKTGGKSLRPATFSPRTRKWHGFKMHFLHSQSTDRGTCQKSPGMSRLFRTATRLAILIHCDLLWIFERWPFILKTGETWPRSDNKVLKDQPQSLYCHIQYDIEVWTFFYYIYKDWRTLPLKTSTWAIWVPDPCSFHVLDCSTNVSGTWKTTFPWIYHAQNLRKHQIYFDKCFITKNF